MSQTGTEEGIFFFFQSLWFAEGNKHDLTHKNTHTCALLDLLFKFAADAAGTCMIARGDSPAAFLAVTVMLTAEYDT